MARREVRCQLPDLCFVADSTDKVLQAVAFTRDGWPFRDFQNVFIVTHVDLPDGFVFGQERLQGNFLGIVLPQRQKCRGRMACRLLVLL